MNKLIYIIVLLFILPSLIANTQTSETQDTTALTIIYPKIDIYAKNSQPILPFDILDSDFIKQDNTSVNCSFQLLNNDGLNISEGNLTYSQTYWYYQLTNTQNTGTYSYYVHCNSATEQGFVSQNIQITPSGLLPSLSDAILYSVLLFVLIGLLTASVFGTVKINGSNKFTMGGDLLEVNFNKYIKFGLGFLSYLLLIFVIFVSNAISQNFLALNFLSDILGLIHYLLWILFVPFFIIIVIVMLVKFVMDLRLDKTLERNLKPRKGGKRKW